MTGKPAGKKRKTFPSPLPNIIEPFFTRKRDGDKKKERLLDHKASSFFTPMISPRFFYLSVLMCCPGFYGEPREGIIPPSPHPLFCEYKYDWHIRRGGGEGRWTAHHWGTRRGHKFLSPLPTCIGAGRTECRLRAATPPPSTSAAFEGKREADVGRWTELDSVLRRRKCRG